MEEVGGEVVVRDSERVGGGGRGDTQRARVGVMNKIERGRGEQTPTVHVKLNGINVGTLSEGV